MWALEWENQLLVVDSGLMFPQLEMHGVDLVIPDISYLLQPGKKVLGIVLTHGHEDHIGALPFVLKRLNVPVYSTRLTLGLAKPKLKEHRILREADLREVRIGDRFRLGPFSVEMIAVCHSIPDATALAIKTPVGMVIYTGDFKLDDDPPEGRPTDLARLAQLGRDGVLLLLGDSTNAEREGHSGSERDLLEPFERIFREAPSRIVVASFASNLHRIQQVISLAEEYGRRVGIAGRSLQTNMKTAQELGYLRVPAGMTIPLKQVDSVPLPKLLMLMAGSQGEPMSSLSRYANRSHPAVGVREGDWVVISATPIPGNETLVNRTINNLYKHGAEVFYSTTGKVHVSGHAYREEIRTLIDTVRPRFFVPVHGEYRQLLHNSRIALAAGVPRENLKVIEDGQVLELTADSMVLGEQVPAGYVFVDGLGIGDVEQVVLRDRGHLAADGLVVVTIGLDRATGALRSGPELISRGFMEEDSSVAVLAEARKAVIDSLKGFDGEPEPAAIKETAHDAVQRVIWRRTQRQPMVIPVVIDQ
ncbi:MAG: ribonuclease J [Chloroflexi bacterium]|nr:MAG: ribonuclease J [Chloroflexota bacterium]